MRFFTQKKFFSPRNLAIMGLMTALKVVLSSFTIYVTPTFRIFSLGYLPGAIISILYGPVAGLLFGFASDLVGYIAKPMGPYLPVYALSAMVANLIYAFFLYRKPLTIWRVTLAQIAMTTLVIFGMGYLWNVLLYGGIASTFFTSARFLSNLVNVPIYVALIISLGKLSLRLVKKSGNTL